MGKNRDESSVSSASIEMKPETDQAGFARRMGEIIGEGRNAAAFGRKVGLSGSVILKYLEGKSDPSRSRLLSIARGAGVSVEWLATGSGPKTIEEREAERISNEGRTDKNAIEAQYGSQDGFLDPEVVLKEAEFILDAFSSLQGQVTPAGAASALIDRVRERMRLMRENEEQEGDRSGKIRA